MAYAKTKKEIEKIRNKNEAMFRMAISHLLDVGIRHLTEENIEANCREIMQEDDGKSFMTNEFKCDLIRMAGELAKLDHIHLLAYISREMYFGVDDNHIDYQRAIQIVQECIDWIISGADSMDAYNDLMGVGFDEEELEYLGYEYLLDAIEEDE